MTDNARIVLIDTSHPGNIGAVARAMKTMCLNELHLVRPSHYPHADATARAVDAQDVLGAARVHQSLDDALADCVLVFGSSARQRTLKWPVLEPRACAEQIIKAGNQPVAILFGREQSGLTNEELARCHYLVQIPANPDYSSLNIAAAAQIICYEILLARRAGKHGQDEAGYNPPVAQLDMERFYEHLEQVLIELEFLNPEQPKRLMPRLRRLFNRARPDTQEMNILRGILTAVQSPRR